MNTRRAVKQSPSKGRAAALASLAFLTSGIGVLTSAGQASADAGWTPLPVRTTMPHSLSWARACKTWSTGGFGDVWRISLQVQRAQPYDGPQYIAIWSDRGDGTPSNFSSNNQWLFGVVSGVEGFASIVNHDVVTFGASDPQHFGPIALGTRNMDPSTLATCA